MGHEVLFAFAASHVHSNDGLWPRDGVAQLPLADRVRCDQCGLAVRTSVLQRAIDQQIQLARKGFNSDANRPQLTDAR